MRKGLVFSVRQEAVIVLDESGTYVKLKKKPGLAVGQTIYYFEEDRLKAQKRFDKRWLAVAAMFLILLGSWQVFERTAVYGYVTVDINPSVEFVLGPSTRVKKVLALNEDASTFALERYRQMPVQEAVLAFIDEAEAKGFIVGNDDDAVTVSYIPVSRKALSFTGFDDVLRGVIESANLQARMTVTVLETDAAHLEAATTAGEPLGHYVEHVPKSAKVKKVYPRDEGEETDDDEDEMSEEADDTDVRFDGEDEASDDDDDKDKEGRKEPKDAVEDVDSKDDDDDDDVFETDDDEERQSADDSEDDEASAPSLPDKPEVQEQEADDDTDSEVKAPTTDDDALEEEEVDDDAAEEIEEMPSDGGEEDTLEAEEEAGSEDVSEDVSEEDDEANDTEEIDD